MKIIIHQPDGSQAEREVSSYGKMDLIGECYAVYHKEKFINMNKPFDVVRNGRGIFEVYFPDVNEYWWMERKDDSQSNPDAG